MVVTGIFHFAEEGLVSGESTPYSEEVYEEKISDFETLVSVRARDLRQAMLLSDLLCQAGAENVEIDALAA